MIVIHGTPNRNSTFSAGYFFVNINDGYRGNSNDFIQLYFIDGAVIRRLNSWLVFAAEVWGLGNLNGTAMFPGVLAVLKLKTLKKERISWTFSLATIIFHDRADINIHLQHIVFLSLLLDG